MRRHFLHRGQGAWAQGRAGLPNKDMEGGQRLANPEGAKPIMGSASAGLLPTAAWSLSLPAVCPPNVSLSRVSLFQSMSPSLCSECQPEHPILNPCNVVQHSGMLGDQTGLQVSLFKRLCNSQGGTGKSKVRSMVKDGPIPNFAPLTAISNLVPMISV